MADSLLALLITALAAVPGAAGEYLYRLVLGVDWREKEFRTALRVLSISVFGGLVYTVTALGLGLPQPVHLLPSTFLKINSGALPPPALVAPYFGHFACGCLVGGLAAYGSRLLAKLSRASAHPSCWDEFVRACVQRRWVVVSLNNGQVYAGKIKGADTSVAAEDRNVLLEEPALLDERTGDYISLPYQHMFVSAATIYSITTVSESSDSRVVHPGESLFPRAVHEPELPPSSVSDRPFREGLGTSAHAHTPTKRSLATTATEAEAVTSSPFNAASAPAVSELPPSTA